MTDEDEPLSYNQPDLATRLEWEIGEYCGERDTYWNSRTDGADWDLRERLRGYADRLAEGLLSDTKHLNSSSEYRKCFTPRP
jgi:hypothetical protein